MRDKSTLEQEVETTLRREAERYGGRCVKFLPDYQRGWPDRILLLPGGVLVWVELKRPRGGKVSSAQVVAHETLRRLGQRVELVLTKERARELVDELAGAGGIRSGDVRSE